ncbi:PTS sugar transporter subunit IIA [Salipaludibacillus aurantiacus]|uniref:Ascorbate-specific PTS system EIIA component n=1 Tax=Salipaludibacillus aurantiacus TaxID=1601833 RepID=A0A1H9W314_9BACI|nr:PTS sugar transporter subunit IIA [Salipaludibacillus aurantiacus]SES28184.1 PTS system, mannitol-specific IIA component/PTS system, ascorbate-specific IIA component [Salipaludibacillus aurantiacus]
MLSNYLENTIELMDSVSSWEESIKIAAQPLLNQGNINESYIEDMISNIHEYGPYIVIVPGVAMPHAQNNGGVNKNGVSLLKLEQPVFYPEDKEVRIVMVLAATDSSGHLDLISDLSSVLADDDVKNSLENADSKNEILSLIKSVE